MEEIINEIRIRAERIKSEKLLETIKKVDPEARVEEVVKEYYPCSFLEVYYYRKKIVLRVRLDEEIKLSIW